MGEEKAKKLDLPPPPEKPLPAECCERGCEKCVYDYYAEAYERWQDEIARILKENDIEFHPSGREE